MGGEQWICLTHVYVLNKAKTLAFILYNTHTGCTFKVGVAVCTGRARAIIRHTLLHVQAHTQIVQSAADSLRSSLSSSFSRVEAHYWAILKVWVGVKIFLSLFFQNQCQTPSFLQHGASLANITAFCHNQSIPTLPSLPYVKHPFDIFPLLSCDSLVSRSAGRGGERWKGLKTRVERGREEEEENC